MNYISFIRLGEECAAIEVKIISRCSRGIALLAAHSAFWFLQLYGECFGVFVVKSTCY